MAPIYAELDDHQRFVLMKFKRTVSDITQPHHDDKFLLRWLRARSWDAEAAEKMLRQSMVWRQQWEVDGALKSWQPPEPIVNYFPYGTTGYDKDGCPVIVVPFAGFDVVGILHSVSKQDVIKMTIKTLEENLDMAATKGVHQLAVIFDMAGFNLRPWAWRPAAELVVSMIQMYEANYPEILKIAFIINAPSVFAIAFNVIKKFMNEYTLGKIQIFKSDPKKWKRAIFEHIDPDNIPQQFGGNLKDPDGNPKYTTVVKQGGKIPKHYYKKKIDDNNSDIGNSKQYTSVVIKKGDKLTLDYIVAEGGSYLRWDFRTDSHDIKFGVSLKDASGKATSVIDHKRVAAHQMDESGVVECQSPATYTITFDNTYSVWRSKKLHYNIQVTPPMEKVDVILPSDVEEGVDIAAATTSVVT